MRSDNMLALYAANHTHVKPQVFTGNDISIERTVNDFANLTISGRMQEKANWGKIDAVSSQSGTPSPGNPVPIETNLSAGAYCFPCTQPRGGYYTFTLDEAMYSIGSVCDKIEADGYSGSCREKRSIGSKVLDGTETVTQHSTTVSGKLRYGIMVSDAKAQVNDTARVLCNKYPSKLNGGTYRCEQGISQYDMDGRLIIYDANHDTDIVSFKSYLAAQYAAGTPVTVVYERATPATSTIPTTWSATPIGTELSLDALDVTKSPDYPVTLAASEGSVRSEGRAGANRIPSTAEIPVLRYISDDVRDTWEPRVWHEGAWRSRLTEKVGCYVFDGTEYFNGFALYEDRSKAYVQYRNYISNVNHPYYGKCVSNSFTWNGIASSAANPYGKFSINDTTLNFACSPSLTDVTSFRAYFAAQYAAGTPVTVWYALAAPIITYGDPVPINTYPYYTRLTTACEVQPDVSAKCKIIGG